MALIFLLALTAVVMVVGVFAITNAQKIQFNLSTQYAPEVYVGVEMKVDGAYKQIYSSQNPAEVNYTAYYIESVSNNTINLKNENLFISANAVQLKFYNYDTRYKINCYINNSGSPISLAKPTSSSAPTIQEHSVSVGENQLGIVLISLRFEALEEITISFNSGAGSACSDITFTKGENAVLPTPTLTGYEFKGWFADENYATQVTTTTTLTQNTTLYAKWEEELYNLSVTFTYESNDTNGDLIHDESSTRYPVVLIGEEIALIGELTFMEYADEPEFSGTIEQTYNAQNVNLNIRSGKSVILYVRPYTNPYIYFSYLNLESNPPSGISLDDCNLEYLSTAGNYYSYGYIQFIMPKNPVNFEITIVTGKDRNPY